MLNWSNPNCVISQGGDADVFADSVELMVIGDLFDQRVAIVFKQDEVPHVIQKQPRTEEAANDFYACLLYTSPSPRDQRGSRMPSSA